VIPNLPVTGLSVTTSAPTSGAYVFLFVSLTCTLVMECAYALMLSGALEPPVTNVLVCACVCACMCT